MNKAKLGLACCAYIAVLAVADLANGLAARTLLPLLDIAAFWTCCVYLIPTRAWRWIVVGMVAISVVVSLGAMAQVYAESSWFLARAHGGFSSPNFLAGYAVLHIFLAGFLRPAARRSWLCDVAIACNIAAVGFSQSLGGIIACGAGFAVLVAYKYPRRVPEFFAAAALIFVLFANMTYVAHTRGALLDDPRLSIWLEGLKIARWRLLFGYGEQSFLAPSGYVHFYNDAIACLIMAGVAGLAAAVWVLGSAARATYHTPNAKEGLALRAFLFAWVANGVFIYSTPETLFPLGVVLSYLVSLHRNVAHAARGIDDRQTSLYRRRASRWATSTLHGKG